MQFRVISSAVFFACSARMIALGVWQIQKRTKTEFVESFAFSSKKSKKDACLNFTE